MYKRQHIERANCKSFKKLNSNSKVFIDNKSDQLYQQLKWIDFFSNSLHSNSVELFNNLTHLLIDADKNFIIDVNILHDIVRCIFSGLNIS